MSIWLVSERATPPQKVNNIVAWITVAHDKNYIWTCLMLILQMENQIHLVQSKKIFLGIFKLSRMLSIKQQVFTSYSLHFSKTKVFIINLHLWIEEMFFLWFCLTQDVHQLYHNLILIISENKFNFSWYLAQHFFRADFGLPFFAGKAFNYKRIIWSKSVNLQCNKNWRVSFYGIATE